MQKPALNYQIAPDDFSDWQGLYDLLVECFDYMDGRIDPPSSLKQMTPTSLEQKAKAETLVIVTNNNMLVGCGYLKLTDKALYIGKLAVKPGFRRQGILRRIINIAETKARQHQKPSLELETRIELVENHTTFARLGFVKTAETSHPDYEKITGITMNKQV